METPNNLNNLNPLALSHPDTEGCVSGCLLLGLPVMMFFMSIVCMLD